MGRPVLQAIGEHRRQIIAHSQREIQALLRASTDKRPPLAATTDGILRWPDTPLHVLAGADGFWARMAAGCGCPSCWLIRGVPAISMPWFFVRWQIRAWRAHLGLPYQHCRDCGRRVHPRTLRCPAECLRCTARAEAIQILYMAAVGAGADTGFLDPLLQEKEA